MYDLWMNPAKHGASWNLKCMDHLKETRKQTYAHLHSTPPHPQKESLLQYTDPFSHEDYINSQKNVHTYTLESRSSSMVPFVTASAFPVACSRHLGLLATFL